MKKKYSCKKPLIMNSPIHVELCGGKLIILGKGPMKNFKEERPLADIALQYAIIHNEEKKVDAVVLFHQGTDYVQELTAAQYKFSSNGGGRMLIVKHSKEFPINVRCTESFSACGTEVERIVKSIWKKADFFISGALGNKMLDGRVVALN
ncbi:MAG: hypothetical protein JWL92_122 [Candidatus Nomurabacteria bacterium]|nr:hypothetical protein [Candidatus Nomurabacteria bacterium]